MVSRRTFLGILASALAWFVPSAFAQKEGSSKGAGKNERRKREDDNYALPRDLAEFALLSLVLGRVSDRSVNMSALAKESMEGYFEYGTAPGKKR